MMTTAVGTAHYMAPELCQVHVDQLDCQDSQAFIRNSRAQSRYNATVDQYSFGVLMSEMSSHTPPWLGITQEAIYRSVVAGKRPEVSADGCPPLWFELMAQCWAHEADRRPDFEEVVSKLEFIRDSLGLDWSSEDLVENDLLNTSVALRSRPPRSNTLPGGLQTELIDPECPIDMSTYYSIR